MFISTREMLGQLSNDRASAESAIEEQYGATLDWAGATNNLAINSTIRSLGLNAFSDGALHQILSILREQQKTA